MQRALFENGCRSLMLLVAPTRQDVEDMFEDQNHFIWMDETADQHLGQRLAGTRNSSIQILQSNLDILATMDQELQQLARRQSGDWKRKFLCKLMWTKPLSNIETHYCKILEELGQSNDLFRCCVLQAVPPRINDLTDISQLSPLEASLHQKGQIARERELDAYVHCVQEASQNLFDVLSSKWPCQDRSAHSYSAYLDLDSLRAFHSDSSRHIRINLNVSISPHGENFWLVVHSSQSESCFCHRSEEEIDFESLSRTISATTRADMFPPNMKVHPPIQELWHSNSDNNDCSSSQQSEHPDLSLTEDLCTYLQKSDLKHRSSGDRKGTSCLGYMTASGIFRHLSFHSQNEENVNNDLFSLDHALLRHFVTSTEEKLKLASLLAAAMFQLDTTPWLLKGWSSNDIWFFQSDQYDGKTGPQKPFLRRHIQGSHTEDPGYGMASLIVTDSHIFSLCLILLELAFSSPFRKLQLPESIAKDLTVSEREKLTVTWLVETVSRKVGSRYAEVVRYCFSHGLGSQESSSLEQPPPSHRMSVDIVNELNRCLLAWSIEPVI